MIRKVSFIFFLFFCFSDSFGFDLLKRAKDGFDETREKVKSTKEKYKGEYDKYKADYEDYKKDFDETKEEFNKKKEEIQAKRKEFKEKKEKAEWRYNDFKKGLGDDEDEDNESSNFEEEHSQKEKRIQKGFTKGKRKEKKKKGEDNIDLSKKSDNMSKDEYKRWSKILQNMSPEGLKKIFEELKYYKEEFIYLKKMLIAERSEKDFVIITNVSIEKK